MQPTFDVAGIPHTILDFKAALSGRFLMRALTYLSALMKHDVVRALINGGVNVETIPALFADAPEVFSDGAFCDLVNLLIVPVDPKDERYAKLDEAARRDLALDVPLVEAYAAITSFFVSTKTADASSVSTLAAAQ